MAPTRTGLRRPALGVAGQLLNAATNVATAFVASYLLRPDDFGWFVLAYAVVTIVLATGRGLVGATLLAHLPGRGDARRSELTSSALGFTIVAGLAATAVLAVLALVLTPLAWFVPWVAAALLHDACRHVFLADGRSGSALLLDAAWALAQIAVFVIVIGTGAAVTIGVVATAWGVGAVAGLVVFAVLSPLRPRSPGRWVRTTRDVAGWFTGSAVVGQCEVYLVLLLAGSLLTPVDAGGLRVVQLIALQPAMVLLGALLVLATPAFARRAADGCTPAELNRAAARVGVAVLPVVALILLVVPLRMPLMYLVLPHYLAFSSLVLPVALQTVTFALCVPPLALLHGLRRGAQVFRLQVARIVLVLGASLAGLAVAGVAGVAWAQVVAGALSTATMIRAALRARADSCAPRRM